MVIGLIFFLIYSLTNIFIYLYLLFIDALFIIFFDAFFTHKGFIWGIGGQSHLVLPGTRMFIVVRLEGSYYLLVTHLSKFSFDGRINKYKIGDFIPVNDS